MEKTVKELTLAEVQNIDSSDQPEVSERATASAASERRAEILTDSSDSSGDPAAADRQRMGYASGTPFTFGDR